jgi:hypothetical protein
MAPLIGTINVFYQGMEHFESGLIQIFNLKFNHVKAYFTEDTIAIECVYSKGQNVLDAYNKRLVDMTRSGS